MKAPSLQKTAALSAALHATLFLISIIALRNSGRMTMPSPYIVDLVSPGEVASVPAGRTESAQEAAPAAETARAVEKTPVVSRADEKRLEDRLREFKAMERIKRLSDLRNKLAAIKPTISQRPAASRGVPAGTTPVPGSGRVGQLNYGDKVKAEIHENYECPAFNQKNLETKINIKIQSDGTISLGDVVKRSGNRSFDRCALQAIQRTARVTPPQRNDDTEIEVTFRL
ncbi:MAG: energy transducer TonB [Nitrospiraceae bacterium]|nr:energy transducer TonB [Nitrospiraceae bacterium]